MRAAGLTDREAHRAALALAIVTAPWAFLIPTPMRNQTAVPADYTDKGGGPA